MLWLARNKTTLPPGLGWLTPAEAKRATTLRYPKRHGEYLLRRLTAKHAVALALSLPADTVTLSRIAVLNAPSGAPYVLIDGEAAGLDVSISDRAGWAVCLVGSGSIGCDLELVEPRTAGFVRSYLTGSEQAYVAAAEDRAVAANLMWSAKESALKALRLGLHQDARGVEVTVHNGGSGGWTAMSVRTAGGLLLPGWWRQDGRFLFTVVTSAAVPPPHPLGDPLILATAVPDDRPAPPPGPDPSGSGPGSVRKADRRSPI